MIQQYIYNIINISDSVTFFNKMIPSLHGIEKSMSFFFLCWLFQSFVINILNNKCHFFPVVHHQQKKRRLELNFAGIHKLISQKGINQLFVISSKIMQIIQSVSKLTMLWIKFCSREDSKRSDLFNVKDTLYFVAKYLL